MYGKHNKHYDNIIIRNVSVQRDELLFIRKNSREKAMRHKKKTMSLKSMTVTAVSVFTAITVSSACFAVFLSWWKSSDHIVYKIAEKANSDIHKQIQTYIEIPAHLNTINAGLIANGIVDLKNTDHRFKYFTGVLQSSDDVVYSFSYGNEKGEYYGARRNESGVIEYMSDNDETNGHSWYYEVKSDLSIGQRVLDAGEFDPRTRDWYQVAKEKGVPVYSHVYKHFVMPDLAISASYPIYEKNGTLSGVLGTHIVLSNLNGILKQLMGSLHGFAVIYDRNTGELIANSADEANFLEKKDGFQRISISQIPQSVLSQAYNQHKNTNKGNFIYKTSSEEYYITVTAYNNNSLAWEVLSAVPKSILFSQIYQSMRITVIFIVLMVFLALLFLYIVAKKAMIPFKDMTETVETIAAGDLSKRLHIYRDNEIGKIVRSFNKMADTIQENFNKTAEREAHLRMAEESAGFGTYTYDYATRKTVWSAELRKIMGLGKEEPVVKGEDGCFTGIHKDDRQQYMEARRRIDDPCGSGLLDQHYRVVWPDGTIRWLHSRGQVYYAEEESGRRAVLLAGAVVDVTERIEAEESVREISEELKNIIDSTEDFVWSVDKDFRFMFFNSSVKKYMADVYECHLEKGMNMFDVYHDEYAETWERFYRKAMEDGEFQIDIKSKKGCRYLSLSFHRIVFSAERSVITVFGKNITDRILSEREVVRLNKELEERVAERTKDLNDSITEMKNYSLILSHDLKNPIREIAYIAKQMSDGIHAEASSAMIVKICGKTISMVDSLLNLAMSSRKELTKEKINVNKIISSVFEELTSGLQYGRTILEYETGFPYVIADKVLLRQAIANILSNALNYSSKKESPKITVGCRAENKEYVFYFKDNGVGLDMERAGNVFNLFERLHAPDEFEGSGIGLAMVKSIIMRHGGRTWIEGVPNIGTVLYFSLPITAEDV